MTDLMGYLDHEYAWADEAQAEARAMLGYGASDALAAARDGHVVREATAEEVQDALDDIPVVSSYEALEALRMALPIKEPVHLTRQSARRLAIQLCWSRISQPNETGVKLPRAVRRRLMFNKKERIFNFSDIARGLVGLTG